MYTGGTRTTGRGQLLPRNTPGPCRLCLPSEPPFPRCAAPGYGDRWRNGQAPGPGDAGGSGFVADWGERNARRSPQRRPVFAPLGPCGRTGDPSQTCPYELNPAPWRSPPPGAGTGAGAGAGAHHCPPVREQCSCVSWAGERQLPPSRFRGQARRHRQTVAYVSQGDEEVGAEEEDQGRGHWGSAESQRLHATNGHGGPGPARWAGGEGGEGHQDWNSARGGSQEGCNGSYKAVFSTEVPQTHLRGRRKGPRGPPSDASSWEPSASAGGVLNPRRRAVPDPERHSVRDQIRQVVTHLEDVLGGLKQVHMEMKEVVEQIDRLTANIDLGEGGPAITHAGSGACDVPSHPSPKLEGASEPSPKAAVVQLSRRIDEDHVILRTNSPSPVHVASVVKTNRIAPPNPCRDATRDRPGVNSYPSHLYPPRASNHIGRSRPEPPPRLDPAVILENRTPGSRTHKPPLYPQNGRCGNGPCPPTNPRNTPGRRRQSTSMV